MGRALTVLLPALMVSHPRDEHAFVLRAWLQTSALESGAWAGKIGSHDAHHRFGTFGRLPHLQVNVWRIGVKGSGVSYRLPLLSPARLVLVFTQSLS